jgi:predicted RNA-binding protein with PUA-like domain
LKPVKSLQNPVTLTDIKAEQKFENMELVKNSRLSVQKVTPDEWKLIVKMSGEK